MGERNNNAEWHRRQNARIARIAKEMGKLFTPGHDVAKTASYEATRAEYLQVQTDKQWHDYSEEPLTKDHRSCG